MLKERFETQSIWKLVTFETSVSSENPYPEKVNFYLKTAVIRFINVRKSSSLKMYQKVKMYQKISLKFCRFPGKEVIIFKPQKKQKNVIKFWFAISGINGENFSNSSLDRYQMVQHFLIQGIQTKYPVFAFKLQHPIKYSICEEIKRYLHLFWDVL